MTFVKISLFASCATFSSGGPSQAAILTVNELSDPGCAGDGKCTLREAVANTEEDADTSGGDCPAGIGPDTIDFGVSGTIALTSRLPEINSELVLDGSKQGVTLSGNNNTQIVRVKEGATVTLTGMALVDGSVDLSLIYPGSTPDSVVGGAVFNRGRLTIQNSKFAGNNAWAGGGAISNHGSCTVIHSAFENNGGGGGSANGGDLKVIGSTFKNSGSRWSGSAISSFKDLSAFNSTFSGNTAGFVGVLNRTGKLTVVNSRILGNSNGGIAIYGGTLAVVNTIISNPALDDNTFDPIHDCILFATAIVSKNGNNLIEDGSCDPAVRDNPLLGPLADNGGGVETVRHNSMACIHEQCEALRFQ